MQESAEGLNCLGICACLTEGFSTTVAAKIIRELFLLYDPPAELTPALRQWIALVECSGGLLASSEFGLVLHGLTKLCLKDGQYNLRRSGSPKSIALVLKEVFELSAGRLERVFLSGGADCAWIATVAHWLLDLRVEVQDDHGTVIYRPDGTRSESSVGAQVIITYHEGLSNETLQVSRKHYVISSGKILVHHGQHQDIMSYGRVQWENCLVDTFGRPMRLLLGSQARSTGACLGYAARIILAGMGEGEGHMEFSVSCDMRASFPPVSESSYGRGLFLLARRLLPELGKNPVLHQTMKAAMDKEYVDAAQQFCQSMTSLRQLCSCKVCRQDTDNAEGETTFCLLALIQTIFTLVRTMSTICMQQDLELQPTRSGLESLYWTQKDALISLHLADHDPVRDLLGSWPGDILVLAQTLFASRQHERNSTNSNIVATSHSGLCFCLNTLMEITSDPQRACAVTIVPGKIEWNNFVHDMVYDQGTEYGSFPGMTGYNAASMKTVTKYDGLANSSTPGLIAELIVEEVFPESTCLSAVYRVSTAAFPGRSFSFGAEEIWRKLNIAFTATSCEGRTCGSLNGFQSILAEGEGILLPMDHWHDACLPITRVLSAQGEEFQSGLLYLRLIFRQLMIHCLCHYIIDYRVVNVLGAV